MDLLLSVFCIVARIAIPFSVIGMVVNLAKMLVVDQKVAVRAKAGVTASVVVLVTSFSVLSISRIILGNKDSVTEINVETLNGILPAIAAFGAGCIVVALILAAISVGIPVVIKNRDYAKRIRNGELMSITCSTWVSLNRADPELYPIPCDCNAMDRFFKQMELKHRVHFNGVESRNLRALIKQRQNIVKQEAERLAQEKEALEQQRMLDEEQRKAFEARKETLLSAQQMLSTIRTDINQQNEKNVAEATRSSKLIQTIVQTDLKPSA